MGKTAFALNVGVNMSTQLNKPVAIFNLEMSKEQLITRMLCMESGMNSRALKSGTLHTDDWQNLSNAIAKLSEAPIYIDDSSMITPGEVRAKCRRLKAEHKELGMVIIDYLQLMETGNSENRVQEVSKISRSLKQLARELNVPVVALSQLSRAVESRNNKRPMLSDLRESGSIEQDADIVMFLYRDEYYNPDSNDKNTAEVIVAKHRHGPTGTIKLYFEDSLTRFGNLLAI
jgi:replicative DNA helicase